jgi:hypothetical protein
MDPVYADDLAKHLEKRTGEQRKFCATDKK